MAVIFLVKILQLHLLCRDVGRLNVLPGIAACCIDQRADLYLFNLTASGDYKNLQGHFKQHDKILKIQSFWSQLTMI